MSTHNNEIPDLNLDDRVASQMLDNIFRSCSVPPSAVPLRQIQRCGKYKRTDFRFCQWLTGVLIVLLLMVPILFIPATMEMSDITHPDGNSATIRFAVDSLLPVYAVKASLNGRELSVDTVDYNSFATEVTENGNLDVTIVLVNGRSTFFDLEVDSVIGDKDPPVITHSSLTNHELTVYIIDEKSEVVLSGAYAIDTDGKTVLPLSYDDATGAVVLPYYNSVLNMFVSDTNGNELHAIISPKTR